MAKKKKEYTFSEIGSLISNSIESTSIILEKEGNVEKKEFIGTGIYLLNALLSSSIYGGILNNRIVTFAGDSGCLTEDETVNVYIFKNKIGNIELFNENEPKHDISPKFFKGLKISNNDIINELKSNYDLDFLNSKTELELLSIFNDFLIKNSEKIQIKKLIENHQNSFVIVSTPDGWMPVSNFFIKKEIQTYQIETKNGHSLKCSSDHYVETTEGWTSVKDLKKSHILITIDGKSKLKSKTKLDIAAVYDLSVENMSQRYWAGSGISSHNTGKSFLCYNIAREAQTLGYSIIYIDTEFSIELNQLPNYGIDISKEMFTLVRSNVVEDLRIFLAKFLKDLKDIKDAGDEIPKILVILDSVGQMASRKEVNDATEGKEKADFTRAKTLGSLFRIINSDLGYLRIPMICTNHTYMCLTGDQEVIMSDNTTKYIKDIKIGEYVQTLDGPKEVIDNFNYPDCQIIKIELENGEIVKCTPEHKFLVKNDFTQIESWKSAKDLNSEDYILSI